MKKRLILLLCLLLALPLCAQAASKLENFMVKGGEMSFTYAFDYPDEYVMLRYSTSRENGEVALHSSDGHFEGEVQLVCTYDAEKVTVKVENLAQYNQGKASAMLTAAEAPAAPRTTYPEGVKKEKKVKDFVCEPIDGGVKYSFTAPGHQSVRLKFKTAQQDGTIVLYADENYAYSGELLLPYTYRKTNVYLEVYPTKGSRVMGEAKAVRGYTLTAALEEPIPGRLSGVTVCVDAGHQGIHRTVKEPMGPGVSGYTISKGGMAQGKVTWRMESIVALEYSFRIRDELMRQGATVIMTRETEDTWLSNIDRANIAEAGGADFMLRIHCNTRSNRKVTGIGVYGPISDYSRAAAPLDQYKAMGQALLDAMNASVGYKVEGNKPTFNSEYAGSNWAKMPCFLLELGYMSNKEEDVRLSHPYYQQQLTEGIVQGVYEMAVIRGLIEEE